jgi:hypothetical protein
MGLERVNLKSRGCISGCPGWRMMVKIIIQNVLIDNFDSIDWF